MAGGDLHRPGHTDFVGAAGSRVRYTEHNTRAQIPPPSKRAGGLLVPGRCGGLQDGPKPIRRIRSIRRVIKRWEKGVLLRGCPLVSCASWIQSPPIPQDFARSHIKEQWADSGSCSASRALAIVSNDDRRRMRFFFFADYRRVYGKPGAEDAEIRRAWLVQGARRWK